MPGPQISRSTALKIGKWLAAKGRADEAMGILCAGAVSGPNDAEGQALLAEALRLDRDSTLTKAAFARMEGIASEHDGALDTVVARYSPEEVGKLEKEVSRPQFMRAQVGFNNNLKYKDHEFHVQTEDSGLAMPHIITHLFADGGRVIKSHKRSYAESVDRPDVGPFVRSLMKTQHMEMAQLLREGRFDDIIAGKARGGMTVLTDSPTTDVEKVGAPSRRSSEPEKPSQKKKKPTRSSLAPVRFELAVLRSLYGGPERYTPTGDDVLIGTEGAVALAGERFCHAKQAMVRFRSEELWLEDLGAPNGVFLRIRKPVEIDVGDEFMIGDELLRVEKNPARNDGPDPGPTYLWASPDLGRASSFRVVQVLVGGALGTVAVAGGTTMQIGRTMGHLRFPADPLVQDPHCFIEEQAGVIVLSDLGSKTGVFVRVRGEQRLFFHDEIVIGRTRMRVDAPAV